MARRSSPVTQADITRLIKAALAAGVGKEHIVMHRNRSGITMRFSEQPIEETKTKVDDEPSADDSWSDVDAA